MNKTTKLTALFFFLICTTISCKKENLCDCFKGTGNDQTEIRTLEPFTELVVEDKIDVHLELGSEYSAKITGGKNLIPLIKTDIKNKQLLITNRNKCGFMRDYKRKIIVTITLPFFRKLQHNGTGEIYMDDPFNFDTLNYYVSNSGNLHLNTNAKIVYGGMHGTGDVYMKGKINSNFLYALGQGFFYGFETETDEMILTLRTSGKIEVTSSMLLKIDSHEQSTGDIYYKGNPTQKALNLKGKGRLIQS